MIKKEAVALFNKSYEIRIKKCSTGKEQNELWVGFLKIILKQGLIYDDQYQKWTEKPLFK